MRWPGVGVRRRCSSAMQRARCRLLRPWLAALAADLGVFAYDARGHGGASWPDGPRVRLSRRPLRSRRRRRGGGSAGWRPAALSRRPSGFAACRARRRVALGGAVVRAAFPDAGSPHLAEPTAKQTPLIALSARRRAYWPSREALAAPLGARGIAAVVLGGALHCGLRHGIARRNRTACDQPYRLDNARLDRFSTVHISCVAPGLATGRQGDRARGRPILAFCAIVLALGADRARPGDRASGRTSAGRARADPLRRRADAGDSYWPRARQSRAVLHAAHRFAAPRAGGAGSFGRFRLVAVIEGPNLIEQNDLGSEGDRFFGNRLMQERLLAGTDCDKLARRLGVTIDRLDNYETGRVCIGPTKLVAAATALACRCPSFATSTNGRGTRRCRKRPDALACRFSRRPLSWPSFVQVHSLPKIWTRTRAAGTDEFPQALTASSLNTDHRILRLRSCVPARA